jgi:hypothetical protein
MMSPTATSNAAPAAIMMPVFQLREAGRKVLGRLAATSRSVEELVHLAPWLPADWSLSGRGLCWPTRQCL